MTTGQWAGDGTDETLPAPGDLQSRARAVMDAHWQAEGFTVPSTAVYPHQWLWDSCFHAVIWAGLGEPDRALLELETLFAHQADDGFVPHMTYWRDPQRHAGFWGRPLVSGITQPPMYGHALAELARRGHRPPGELVERARAGLHHLLDRPRLDLPPPVGELVPVVHPWETGCDNSPRWDSWCPGGFALDRWYERKGDLVASIEYDRSTGSPRVNPAFAVCPAGFNALVAFNAAELLELVDDQRLAMFLDRAKAGISALWDDDLGCAVDASLPWRESSEVRTVDALLELLVHDHPGSRITSHLFAQLRHPGCFGGPCGPAGVHRQEAAFDPRAYWRGGAWPQLAYLFWFAARRLGRRAAARWFAAACIRGAYLSGFAEYWDPDTGAPGGAVPQSWAALAALMAGEDDEDVPAAGAER